MFQRMLICSTKIVALILDSEFLAVVANCVNSTFLKEKVSDFFITLYTLFATDLMFQQANHPCGNMTEPGTWYNA